MKEARQLAALLLLTACSLAAQVPSQDEKVRIAVWAERDAYPGLAAEAKAEETDEAKPKKDSDEWDYPREEIRRVAKFMVGGMVEGWTFEYTPSDKARGVAEYFDLQEIRPLSDEDKRAIDYTQVWVEGGKVWCWIEFCRTERMRQELAIWKKIDRAAGGGTGYGSVTAGFDGIVEATKGAVKDAVRSRYRALVKNKPRCITGRVLVRKAPKVGISSGRYKVALDFFMETDTIETYNVF